MLTCVIPRILGSGAGKDFLSISNFGNFWGLVPCLEKIGSFACNKFSGEYIVFNNTPQLSLSRLCIPIFSLFLLPNQQGQYRCSLSHDHVQRTLRARMHVTARF